MCHLCLCGPRYILLVCRQHIGSSLVCDVSGVF
jgi:hypothetical protein